MSARLDDLSPAGSVLEYQELRGLGLTHQAACERLGVTVAAMEKRITRYGGGAL